MIRFADLVMANREELALLETLDMGKPISACMNTDVPATANTLRWYGEAIDKVYDEIAPTNGNTLALITREPMGVVGAVVPWNYPMLMASWKIGPALVSGNSVILKPSEKAPLTALRLGELALQAGIPAGVFNVVPGFGAEAGSPLALHLDVDRGGQENPGDGGREQPQTSLVRTGRQVSQHRVCRLPGYRPCGCGCSGLHFLQPG
jgi:gamma-glutamyl-gamma-aminobutyraldehyde dehydrogenase/4-guanidinobutyraldehyde dehydrogenase/NAD-dependent aldehyde dehydrogenase